MRSERVERRSKAFLVMGLCLINFVWFWQASESAEPETEDPVVRAKADIRRIGGSVVSREAKDKEPSRVSVSLAGTISYARGGPLLKGL
jgi:hypothetical protein